MARHAHLLPNVTRVIRGTELPKIAYQPAECETGLGTADSSSHHIVIIKSLSVLQPAPTFSRSELPPLVGYSW